MLSCLIHKRSKQPTASENSTLRKAFLDTIRNGVYLPVIWSVLIELLLKPGFLLCCHLLKVTLLVLWLRRRKIKIQTVRQATHNFIPSTTGKPSPPGEDYWLDLDMPVLEPAGTERNEENIEAVMEQAVEVFLPILSLCWKGSFMQHSC